MGLFDWFKQKATDRMYLYSEEELNQYEAFIEENFGVYTEVFHEVVSPDIHVDIIIVPPTDENNFYKLITMGMGAYKMNVPKELEAYGLGRAELVVYLPPTWQIQSDREADYWPIRCLKILARLPIQNETWLGFGHTVSSDEKNTPYAGNTDFCSILLLNALNLDWEELNLTLPNKGRIQFYQLFPMYQEELSYKNKTDAKGLLERFDEEDILPIVNIYRKNYGLEK